MGALFHEERAYIDALFAKAEYRDAVDVCQGANDSANGYHRPQLQCMLSTRSDAFRSVCQQAIEQIIDLYSQAH